MNCSVEGCPREVSPGYPGLCHNCAAYKKHRLMVWRKTTHDRRLSERKERRRAKLEKRALALGERRRRDEQANKLKRAAMRSEFRQRYNTGKSTASRRGIQWSLSFEAYTDLIEKPCGYCLSPLNPTGVGLDRKDNTQGYLPANVIPCCRNCNTVKSNVLTFDEMKAAMSAVMVMRKSTPI